MNAETFIKSIENVKPSRESLEDYGLEDEEIEEILATFMAPAKKISKEEQNDEIQRMLTSFDCSKIEIGLIRFQDEVRAHSYGKMFAFCEADPLVIRADGSIAMYDHANPDPVPLECAGNSEKFLDALAKFIDIRSKKSNWKGRTVEAAELCAKAAGGSQYCDFFRQLCSFLA